MTDQPDRPEPSEPSEPSEPPEPSGPSAQPDRVELFPAVGGPLQLDVDVLSGRVEVDLTEDGTEAEVTVARLAGEPPGGLGGLLSWVGGQFTDAAAADAAVHDAEVTRSGNRLRVRSVRTLPTRLLAVHVTVRAPAGSAVRVRTGSATVRVTGTPDGVDVVTGSGDLSLEAVAGGTVLRAGVGAVAVGASTGRMRVETGRGEVAVEEVGGPTEVTVGDGDVRVGGVHAGLRVQTGHGEITVRAVSAGELELTSGAGDLRIGLPSGVLAEVDLQGTRGGSHSDVDVRPDRPDGEAAVRLRGRTGAGRVMLTRSARP